MMPRIALVAGLLLALLLAPMAGHAQQITPRKADPPPRQDVPKARGEGQKDPGKSPGVRAAKKPAKAPAAKGRKQVENPGIKAGKKDSPPGASGTK